MSLRSWGRSHIWEYSIKELKEHVAERNKEEIENKKLIGTTTWVKAYYPQRSSHKLQKLGMALKASIIQFSDRKTSDNSYLIKVRFEEGSDEGKEFWTTKSSLRKAAPTTKKAARNPSEGDLVWVPKYYFTKETVDTTQQYMSATDRSRGYRYTQQYVGWRSDPIRATVLKVYSDIENQLTLTTAYWGGNNNPDAELKTKAGYEVLMATGERAWVKRRHCTVDEPEKVRKKRLAKERAEAKA